MIITDIIQRGGLAPYHDSKAIQADCLASTPRAVGLHFPCMHTTQLMSEQSARQMHQPSWLSPAISRDAKIEVFIKCSYSY